jgi:rubredoxin
MIKENDMKVWQCVVCGFIYDETKGDAGRRHQGRGTKWADIRELGLSGIAEVKADFEMIEV